MGCSDSKIEESKIPSVLRRKWDNERTNAEQHGTVKVRCTRCGNSVKLSMATIPKQNRYYMRYWGEVDEAVYVRCPECQRQWSVRLYIHSWCTSPLTEYRSRFLGTINTTCPVTFISLHNGD